MNSPYMTIEEVAAYFSIGKSTVYRMITDKVIPHIKIGGNIRVRKKDVEAIEEKNYIRAKRVSPF